MSQQRNTRMNSQYKYVEKSLTPNMARELIQELFAGQTAQKREIVRAVDETHLERGGLAPRARFHHPVTMALSKMKGAGQADNPRQGNWSIPLSIQDNSVDSEIDDSDAESLDIKKTIGSGKGAVYLYYYPAYQRLAELQDEEVWACKIGKARNDPLTRISSQTRTALPEYPKVGLIIKTDKFNLMERTIQNILKLQGKQKQDAPGKEWFITSPSEVEKLYEKIFGNPQ